MGAGQFISPQIKDHIKLLHKDTGTFAPLIRNKMMISDFDNDGWTKGTYGTMQDDTVNFKFGTKSTQLTSSNSEPVSMTKTVSIKSLQDKILVLNLFVDDALNLGEVRVMVSVEGTGFVKYFDCTYGNDALKTGWNTVAIKNGDFVSNGGATKFVDVTYIRLRAQSTPDTTVNVSFDSLYYLDQLSDRAKLIITFDDGSATVYTNAKPLMDKKGFPGVFYIVTSEVGEENRVTLAQLVKCYTCDWDICSHTKTHQNLTLLDDTTLNIELRDSYKYLIDNGFYRSARHLSYPGGQVNDTVIDAVKNIYLTGRSTKGGSETIPLVNYHDIRQKIVLRASTLTNVQDYINRIVNAKKVGILTFHVITDTPAGDYEWATADFSSLIDYIAASDIDVITMSQLMLFNPCLTDHRIQAAW